MPIEKLKVFVSWSGDRSRIVGEALRDWLPDVLPLVDPFLSTEDVEKGAKWSQVLSGALEQSGFAIICLTPENLNSPWLLFEAGAVAKHSSSRVCTYLFELAYTDVKDPLSQFQHTRADQMDTKKLVASINQHLGEGSISHDRLENAFRMWWPRLEQKLTQVPRPGTKTPVRDPLQKILEMSAEILARVREQGRERTVPSDVYDDNDHIRLSSVVMGVLQDHLKRERIPYQSVGVCEDGAYFIWHPDKRWRIEKSIAEDCMLGRISFSEMLARSSQVDDPCQSRRNKEVARKRS